MKADIFEFGSSIFPGDEVTSLLISLTTSCFSLSLGSLPGLRNMTREGESVYLLAVFRNHPNPSEPHSCPFFWGTNYFVKK